MTDEFVTECQAVAKAAEAAGLKVYGLLAPETGWRPGVLLDHGFMDKRVEAFAQEHGYTVAPLADHKHRAIIEKRNQ